jgi:ribosome silencing factor RsfS/YbeB/iojap
MVTTPGISGAGRRRRIDRNYILPPRQPAAWKGISRLNTTSKAKPKVKTATRKAPAKKAAGTRKAPAKRATGKKSAAAGKPAKKVAIKTVAAPRKVAARADVAAIPSAPLALAKETALLRKQVMAALDELKAKDVNEIDIRARASFADLLFIASGTSTRHVKSIADEVVKFVKKAGMMPLGIEGEKEAEWVLVDLGDIVVHVMLPRIREFYGLERLWSVGGDDDAEAAP